MVHLYSKTSAVVCFTHVIAGLCFARMICGSFALGKNGDLCFTNRNKPSPTSSYSHVSQYFHRTSCDDVDGLESTIRFPSGGDFSVRNIFANRCLMEGWKCDDNSNCVNMGNSFQCLCNHGYTGTGFKCTDMSMTSSMSPWLPKMTGETTGDRVCPGAGPSSPVMWDRSNYCFVPDETSWYTASSECNVVGGHLVVIGSAEENEFLRSVIDERATGSNWVGLSYGEEGWGWIDKGETYLNWGPGEPDRYGVQFCARMKRGTGMLHDKICTDAYAYICEEEIGDG